MSACSLNTFTKVSTPVLMMGAILYRGRKGEWGGREGGREEGSKGGREGGREGGGRGGIHNVKCNDSGFQSSCSIIPKCGHVWDRESCKSMTSGGIGTSQLRCPGRDVHIWGFHYTV